MNDWLVGVERRSAAADRIHSVATELVLRRGLNAIDINVLAAELHCSRATIYRYAGGKTQIRDAVLARLGASIIDTVRREVGALTGHERVVTAVIVALREIRANPMREMMHEIATSPQVADLQSSPALAGIAADLTGIAEGDPQAAQWIVRVVMSFVQSPAANARTEKAMIRRFVAPAFGSGGESIRP